MMPVYEFFFSERLLQYSLKIKELWLYQSVNLHSYNFFLIILNLKSVAHYKLTWMRHS